MTVKLPKLIATSVVRGSQQGESHGGVYTVDFEKQKGEHTTLGLKEFCPETWEDAIGGPGQDAVVPMSWIQEALERE